MKCHFIANTLEISDKYLEAVFSLVGLGVFCAALALFALWIERDK